MVVETFYPSVDGYIAGGVARVIDDVIEVFDGEGDPGRPHALP